MYRITFTDRLHEIYPGFKIAWAFVSGMHNSTPNPQVAELVEHLPAILSQNPEEAVARTESMAQFFKRLNGRSKYHIQSLIKATLNGRRYTGINPAVDLLYAAELESGMLMSIHDAAGPEKHQVWLDVNDKGESIDHICGRRLAIPSTDIIVRDNATILAGISVGIAASACVTGLTRNALVIAYGSPDDHIESVSNALIMASDRFRGLLHSEVDHVGSLVA